MYTYVYICVYICLFVRVWWCRYPRVGLEASCALRGCLQVASKRIISRLPRETVHAHIHAHINLCVCGRMHMQPRGGLEAACAHIHAHTNTCVCKPRPPRGRLRLDAAPRQPGDAASLETALRLPAPTHTRFFVKYVYMCIHIYICVYRCIYKYIYIYMPIYRYIYIYIYVYMCVYICLLARVWCRS